MSLDGIHKLRPKVNKLMDYYTVIFLNPVNGNRFVIEGVNAQVEVRNNFSESLSFKSVHFPIKPKKSPTYLDIVLEFNTTTQEQYNKLKEQIISTELLLWFKDTHPNLIKGFVKGITVDQHLTTITFRGNTTDKTYMDYVTEVSNGLESEQNVITSSEDPIDNSIVNLPEPENERKDSVQELKRKLTF